MLSLLEKGIQVDEEIFHPFTGLVLVAKLLQYDSLTRRLSITSPPPSSGDADRCVDIDDICEVRAGKVSDIVDMNMYATEHWYASIVASASILVLPLATLALRDKFIRKFQAFVQVRCNKRACRE